MSDIDGGFQSPKIKIRKLYKFSQVFALSIRRSNSLVIAFRLEKIKESVNLWPLGFLLWCAL